MIPTAESLPDRAYQLEWVRRVAPDLRIRHGEPWPDADEGPDTCSIALFTIGGEQRMARVEGPDARDKIVEHLYRYVRDLLGRPMRRAVASRAIEQQIVAASFAGNTSAVEALTRELVTSNEGSPSAPREKRYEPIAPARPHPLAPAQLEARRPEEPLARRW